MKTIEIPVPPEFEAATPELRDFVLTMIGLALRVPKPALNLDPLNWQAMEAETKAYQEANGVTPEELAELDEYLMQKKWRDEDPD